MTRVQPHKVRLPSGEEIIRSGHDRKDRRAAAKHDNSATVSSHVDVVGGGAASIETPTSTKPVPLGSLNRNDVYVWQAITRDPLGEPGEAAEFTGTLDQALHEMKRRAVEEWPAQEQWTGEPEDDPTFDEIDWEKNSYKGSQMADWDHDHSLTLDGGLNDPDGRGNVSIEFNAKAVSSFDFGTVSSSVSADEWVDGDGDTIDPPEGAAENAASVLLADPDFSAERFSGTLQDAVDYLEEAHVFTEANPPYSVTDVLDQPDDVVLREPFPANVIVHHGDPNSHDSDHTVYVDAEYEVMLSGGLRCQFTHTLSLNVAAAAA